MSNIVSKAFINPRYTANPTGLILLRYGVLIVIYVLLIFLLPGNQDFMRQHRLTATEYNVLQFVVGLPLAIVWFAAFYGYAKLDEYARAIRNTPEAVGFNRLTQGCAWLAWSLPVRSLAALVARSVVTTHPGAEPAVVIIFNYVSLIFPVIGFTHISMASRHLFERARLNLTGANIRGLTLLFVTGGVLYCYLIFRQFTGSGLTATTNPYHLPLWLTVVTLIVPYLYAWFAGMLAVYELVTYGRQVRGVLYRQAMHLLVLGLLIMIAGSIAFQYSRSFQPSLGHQQILGTYLLFTMICVIIGGIGFVMIALGAIRLKRIEEV